RAGRGPARARARAAWQVRGTTSAASGHDARRVKQRQRAPRATARRAVHGENDNRKALDKVGLLSGPYRSLAFAPRTGVVRGGALVASVKRSPPRRSSCPA